MDNFDFLKYQTHFSQKLDKEPSKQLHYINIMLPYRLYIGIHFQAHEYFFFFFNIKRF
jgi:hypothetical protein